jgi:hypothetical protein
MNNSEGIQQGIFLDLISRQKSKSVLGTHQQKQSGNSSMIYDILLNSYHQKKKKDNKFDFAIEWETFKRFNWRQILGILLMHHDTYETFKSLSRKWN